VTINDSLLEEIRLRLGRTLEFGFTASADASDLFEYYIFSLIITAARKEGAVIEFRDGSDEITENLIFRKSPGLLYRGNFTHARIIFPRKPFLEVHIGIRVQGRGQVAHECDVCVLQHEEARRSRDTQKIPRSSQVIIATECKHYAGNLDLVLARAFIGLVYVLTNLNGDCYFISNSESENVARTLAWAKKKWAFNVVPSSLNEINKLVASFQINFRDFKAKY
jgi:hypothetical protein